MAIDLKKLAQYDFVAVIDGSSSMDTKDSGGFLGFGAKTRWEAIGETAVKFAKDMEQVDDDGIGLVVFQGYGATSYDGVTHKEVAEVFKKTRPNGGTPLAEGIQAAIDLLKNSKKKKFITVFTDGAPNSREAARQVIIKQANSQTTDDELTILFIQVGNDKSALAYLRELDDLKEAKFDIIDTKTVEEAAQFSSTLELVAHAIED